MRGGAWVERFFGRVGRVEEVRMRAYHLADHALALMTVERWVKCVDETVVGLAAAFPLASGRRRCCR